jgi:hypothetical protein
LELDAAAFRLTLPKAALTQAAAELPAGSGPALLLAPSGDASDWPGSRWQALPAQVRAKLPDVRIVEGRRGGSLLERAAQLASCDVVLSSDPISCELALLAGMPLVAIGAQPDQLPSRQGVQAVGEAGSLQGLGEAAVLQALGLG